MKQVTIFCTEPLLALQCKVTVIDVIEYCCWRYMQLATLFRRCDWNYFFVYISHSQKEGKVPGLHGENNKFLSLWSKNKCFFLRKEVITFFVMGIGIGLFGRHFGWSACWAFVFSIENIQKTRMFTLKTKFSRRKNSK